LRSISAAAGSADRISHGVINVVTADTMTATE
jgi:hypothetical protein